jgi:uncharacterized membrane protein
MKAKTTKVLYWTFTILFALLMIFDGIGGITKQAAGVEVMNHLGYPVYSMVIFGIAKILGALAILQNKYKTIKEWAYAGFAFNFICAFASRAAVGDAVFETIFPLIIGAFLFVPYLLWKRIDRLNTNI